MLDIRWKILNYLHFYFLDLHKCHQELSKNKEIDNTASQEYSGMEALVTSENKNLQNTS
jgi:hypothetical protein